MKSAVSFLIAACLLFPLASQSQLCKGGVGGRCAQEGAVCSPVDIYNGPTGKCKSRLPTGETECDCVGRPPTQGPRYAINVSQLSPATVSPGGSAKSEVTIAAAGGFNGNVTLSCSVLGASSSPPACSFSPKGVISPSGAVTLNATISNLTPPGTYTISLSGSDANGNGPTNGSAALSLKVVAKIAQISQPIQSPTFVNLLWDSTWDSDNPGLPAATVNAATSAIVRSTYLSGLSEYGVTSASFAGGFLPDSSCPSRAPTMVGFYDPFQTSIAGFVQCEHDNGPEVLRQANVIYNIILPPSSMESDFWSQNFCTGPGSPAAWHYHGLEKLSIRTAPPKA